MIKKTFLYIEVQYLYKRLKLFFISDKKYIFSIYKKFHRKYPNVDNPSTFNEKICKRILEDRNEIYTELTDKHDVRNYVSKKIGEEYLIKSYGVYKDFDDINLSCLPNSFVIKCTHDSGSVVICKDKRDFDFEKCKLKINRHIKKSFYVISREWHYKNIKPRIIVEEYIGNKKSVPTDYKFHVLKNGDTCSIYIQCDEGRFEDHKRTMLTEDWKRAGFDYKYSSTKELPQRPKNLGKMIELAKSLADGFNMVRVDFYEVDKKIYFGEMTFTSEGGLGVITPKEWDEKLGLMWGDNT